MLYLYNKFSYFPSRKSTIPRAVRSTIPLTLTVEVKICALPLMPIRIGPIISSFPRALAILKEILAASMLGIISKFADPSNFEWEIFSGEFQG